MIYFIQRSSDSCIKIGTTIDLRQRFAALKMEQSCPLKILGVMPGEYEHESKLHQIFSSLRKQGEWFYPDPLLLEFIRTEGFPANLKKIPEFLSWVPEETVRKLARWETRMIRVPPPKPRRRGRSSWAQNSSTMSEPSPEARDGARRWLEMILASPEKACGRNCPGCGVHFVWATDRGEPFPDYCSRCRPGLPGQFSYPLRIP